MREEGHQVSAEEAARVKAEAEKQKIEDLKEEMKTKLNMEGQDIEVTAIKMEDLQKE